MKDDILDILCCPKCKEELDLQIFKKQEDDIEEGVLVCRCGEWYPIFNFVPRMLFGSLRPDYSNFITKYKDKLSMYLFTEDTTPRGELSEKKRTHKSFSFEWKTNPDYGWVEKNEDVDVSDYRAVLKEYTWEHTVKTFWRKTLLKKEELEGKLILDAGIGQGRYAMVAADSNAEIVGLDLSDAVDVAIEQTRGRKVQVVQGDLFNLPFKNGSFDIIYSIGVLHHTPNTEKSFKNLVKVLKKNGTISIHLYHKGNPIWEFNDRLLRFFTTKIDHNILWNLSHIFTLMGKIAIINKHFFAAINTLLRVTPDQLQNFDWYSAPTAFHHTEDEVVVWFKDEGLMDIEGDNPLEHPDSYYAKLYPGYIKNKDGTVKEWATKIFPRWGLTVRGTLK